MNWLTEELKNEVRRIYEPRYNKKLTDNEIVEIAENIEEVVETALKYLWRKKYENCQQNEDLGET